MIDLDDQVDVDLARALREWRNDQARQLSIPPYWIITNATLAAISARLPRTQEELMQIPGMGKARAEKYGGAILLLIQGHINSRRGAPRERALEVAEVASSTAVSEIKAELAGIHHDRLELLERLNALQVRETGLLAMLGEA